MPLLDEEMSDTERTNCTAKKKRIDSTTEKKGNEPINYFFNDFSGSDDEDKDNRLHKNQQSTGLDIPYYEELSKTNSSSLR